MSGKHWFVRFEVIQDSQVRSLYREDSVTDDPEAHEGQQRLAPQGVCQVLQLPRECGQLYPHSLLPPVPSAGILLAVIGSSVHKARGGLARRVALIPLRDDCQAQ